MSLLAKHIIRRPPRCKGSAPKKWGWDGCGRHHLADEVATSTEAAPGNGIIASCWGSAVSQPRSTELLGAVSELCSREFFADEVATSTEAAPGNGIIASSFFRASERNVRHFCGRWFSQVWA